MSDELELRFQLARDVHAVIFIRGTVTRDAIDRFIEYLTVSRETFPEHETAPREAGGGEEMG